ncbi:MAG TPA: hypothetical protein PLC79_04390 [Phycisphaerae bacterium]|nr:hypothetical protein [Phycisphaerae bacterium]
MGSSRPAVGLADRPRNGHIPPRTMTEAIRRHCEEIERCNQRGGRMLSIVDLIDAGTISREVAAYALAAIGRGASFMVGALPGGAGKTTVMGAMLNFVPADVELVAADGIDAIRHAPARSEPRRCYVCHEIGRGDYYAYLWGEPLRAYFELPAAGHMLATNLHADTFEQARRQVCGDNGITERAFRRMSLMFFLSVRRAGWGCTRRIEEVWESDGAGPHRRIFQAGASSKVCGGLASAEDVSEAARIINRLFDRGARTIEQVRELIVEARQ